MTVVGSDAVVIGAGAGGLCAAARLAHAGTEACAAAAKLVTDAILARRPRVTLAGRV